MLALGGDNSNKEEDGEPTRKILFTYPMIKQTDMIGDMRAEVCYQKKLLVFFIINFFFS